MNRYLTATTVCLLLQLVGSTAAQRPNPLDRKELIKPRTDLINDIERIEDFGRQQRNDPAVAAARLVYMNLKTAREANPNSGSTEELSQASLNWFKAQVAVAPSRKVAMKAASAYLEREGENATP